MFIYFRNTQNGSVTRVSSESPAKVASYLLRCTDGTLGIPNKVGGIDVTEDKLVELAEAARTEQVGERTLLYGYSDFAAWLSFMQTQPAAERKDEFEVVEGRSDVFSSKHGLCSMETGEVVEE